MELWCGLSICNLISPTQRAAGVSQRLERLLHPFCRVVLLNSSGLPSFGANMGITAVFFILRTSITRPRRFDGLSEPGRVFFCGMARVDVPVMMMWACVWGPGIYGPMMSPDS